MLKTRGVSFSNEEAAAAQFKIDSSGELFCEANWAFDVSETRRSRRGSSGEKEANGFGFPVVGEPMVMSTMMKIILWCCWGLIVLQFSDSEPLFSTFFPGSELPSWFVHEVVGSMSEVIMPPHWHDNGLADQALCAVISFPDSRLPRTNQTIVNEMYIQARIGSSNNEENIASEHVFIGYMSCSKIFKRLESQHFISSDPTKSSTLSSNCSPTTASLQFMVTDGTSKIPRLEVLKCGLRLFRGGGSSGGFLKKLEVKEVEQNLSAQKLSENRTSESGTTTEVAENGNNAEQSSETVTTEVTASPENANNA
ncbi:unnamed protein product [Eruca vesicaria subsp. sativa]|uniref:C-JID domain-containing protein n=1 Tax=Eruca vesicaria subsp. sativa TaxID=29727 RepID=A0ABC8J0M2_ERUVS|nr:unnamed protein product [Eruca vesicaria subsp. sativa]